MLHNTGPKTEQDPNEDEGDHKTKEEIQKDNNQNEDRTDVQKDEDNVTTDKDTAQIIPAVEKKKKKKEKKEKGRDKKSLEKVLKKLRDGSSGEGESADVAGGSRDGIKNDDGDAKGSSPKKPPRRSPRFGRRPHGGNAATAADEDDLSYTKYVRI